MSNNRASKTAKRKGKLKARADYSARVSIYDFICEHCECPNYNLRKGTALNACYWCKWSKHRSTCRHGTHPAPSGKDYWSPNPCDGMMRPYIVRDYKPNPKPDPVEGENDWYYWVCEGCGLSTQYLDCGAYEPIDQDGVEYFPDEQ